MPQGEGGGRGHQLRTGILKTPIFLGACLIKIAYFVLKKSFMKEAEIHPHIMHDIFRSWLEVVRRGTIQWPWHRSGSQFLWSCQYFERLGREREGEGWEGEKHARQLFSSSCDPGLRSSRCLHLLPDFATEPSASLSLSLFNEQVNKETDHFKIIYA